MGQVLADAERILVDGSREILETMGVSTVTDGTNSDLATSLGYGFGRVGVFPVSGLVPSDEVLATVPYPTFMQAVQWAEYRLLSNLLVRLTLVDQEVADGKASFDQIARRMQFRLTQLAVELPLKPPPQRLVPFSIGLANAQRPRESVE